MPLSLESIFHPFDEFFIQKFSSDEGGPVKFRFAQLPRAFVDSDFLNPSDPGSGPSTAVVNELLSAVVDGVTRFETDGRVVSLSNSSRISDLYHDEILCPAIPFVRADISDGMEREARADSFINAKADAVRLWAGNKVASVSGMTEFRPATAMPSNWWDKTDPNVWTAQSFVIKGAASGQGEAPSPADPMLRMKLDDTTLNRLLDSYTSAVPGSADAPPESMQRQTHPLPTQSGPTMVMTRPMFTAALPTDNTRSTVTMSHPALTSVALPDQRSPQIQLFPFSQRSEIQAMLAANAVSKPVATSDVTINFSYCLVTVKRAWLHNAFINNQSWRVPGQAVGSLSANDGHGVPAVPTGFVAIKNLSIHAPWTPDDISNLEQSVQFGPFNFDSKVVEGAIGHDDIQIIGWILQDLPDLPPNVLP